MRQDEPISVAILERKKSSARWPLWRKIPHSPDKKFGTPRRLQALKTGSLGISNDMPVLLANVSRSWFFDLRTIPVFRDSLYKNVFCLIKSSLIKGIMKKLFKKHFTKSRYTENHEQNDWKTDRRRSTKSVRQGIMKKMITKLIEDALRRLYRKSWRKW